MTSVADVLKHFEVNLKLIDGKKNITNQIVKPGLNRLGFELCGVVVNHKIKNVVVFGNREYVYLMSITPQERKKRLIEIMKLQPPVILLTRSFKKTNFLLEINKKFQIPIIKSDMYSNDIASSIGAYISESVATYQTVHGVLLEIYGEGVLIIGESGIGKSEIALEMVKKNHIFIADDAVDVTRIGRSVLGKSNEIAKNFIEIRGLGILNISKMFGIEKIKASTSVSVIIELLNSTSHTAATFERLGSDQKSEVLCGIKLPKYVLPISPGRKVSDLIESVVIDLKLKREGYNSVDYFIKQHQDIVNKKKKGN